MKYQVKEVDSFESGNGDTVRVFEVRSGDDVAGVWADKTVRCTECSGPLVAMSSSCRHVAAVKRFIAKQPTGGDRADH